MATTHLDSFKNFMKERLKASKAFIEGDFKPLKKISVEKSPATIFGPKGNCIQGVKKVNAINAAGASAFEPSAKNKFEIMHQDADEHLAYWTGIQHSILKMKGQKKTVSMDLRVTEIFKMEKGEWKLMHRHADKLIEE